MLVMKYVNPTLMPHVVTGASTNSVAGAFFRSAAAVGRTALVLVFAFLGAEVALAPSGEVQRPARTVPLSIAIALGVVTLLYLALQATAQAVLGPALARGSYHSCRTARCCWDHGSLDQLVNW